MKNRLNYYIPLTKLPATIIFVEQLSEETGKKIDLSFLEFSMIRDGCFTACAQAHLPIDQRNFVSGHKNLGTDDDYLLRQPELAKPACDAIYNYFIGDMVK